MQTAGSFPAIFLHVPATRAGRIIIHVYGIFLHVQEACFLHISEVMAYFSNLTITFTKLSLFILEYVQC